MRCIDLRELTTVEFVNNALGIIQFHEQNNFENYAIFTTAQIGLRFKSLLSSMKPATFAMSDTRQK